MQLIYIQEMAGVFNILLLCIPIGLINTEVLSRSKEKFKNYRSNFALAIIPILVTAPFVLPFLIGLMPEAIDRFSFNICY